MDLKLPAKVRELGIFGEQIWRPIPRAERIWGTQPYFVTVSTRVRIAMARRRVAARQPAAIIPAQIPLLVGAAIGALWILEARFVARVVAWWPG